MAGGRVSGETVWRRSRRVVAVADPAAGADWSATVPGGHVWVLEAIGARLTTDSTVVSRVPILTIGDGTGDVLEVAPAGTAEASETRRFAWLPDQAGLTGLGGVISPLPRLVLGPGWRVRVATLGLRGGDAWSQIRLAVLDLTVAAGPIELGNVPDLRVEVVVSAVEAGGGGGGAS